MDISNGINTGIASVLAQQYSAVRIQAPTPVVTPQSGSGSVPSITTTSSGGTNIQLKNVYNATFSANGLMQASTAPKELMPNQMTFNESADFHRKKKYDDLPDSQKYKGNLTQQDIVEKYVKTGGNITEQEENYMDSMKDGGLNGNARFAIQRTNSMKDISNDLTDLLTKNGIKLDDNEKLNVKVDAFYNATVSGINDKNKADKITKLLNDHSNEKSTIVRRGLAFEYKYAYPGLENKTSNVDRDGLNAIHSARIRLQDYFGKEGISVDLKKLSLDSNGNIQGLPSNIADNINPIDSAKYAQDGDWAHDADSQLGRLKNNISDAIKYLAKFPDKEPTAGDSYFTFSSVPQNKDAVVQLKGRGFTMTDAGFANQMTDPWDYNFNGTKVTSYAGY